MAGSIYIMQTHSTCPYNFRIIIWRLFGPVGAGDNSWMDLLLGECMTLVRASGTPDGYYFMRTSSEVKSRSANYAISSVSV